jgi:type I restriction enzyme S subunit
MGSEWHVGRFGDLFAVPPRNGIHKGPEFQGRGVPVVKMGEVYHTDVFGDALRDLYDLAPDELRRLEVRSGDLLFCRTSLVPDGVGHCAMVGPLSTRTAFASNLIRVRLDPAKGSPRYWYYFFRSRVGHELLLTLARGTSVTTITGPDIAALEVDIPDLREQHRVAGLLGALDDKIELNGRMRQTLESMARALFKSWFVDFDPVRAKAEGREPGVPMSVADVFPESFQDSEIGEIPQGWRVSILGERLVELVSGARPRGGSTIDGVPSIGAENVVGLGRYDFQAEKFVPEAFFLRLEGKGAAIRDGDVLLYKDGAQIGRKTYFESGFPHVRCAVNEHVFILRTARREDQRFLFFWLDQGWMTQEIVNLNSNSAQPGINQVGVRGLKLLIPPDDVVVAFDRAVAELTRRLFATRKEAVDLAGLRDAILPKLISGSLRAADQARTGAA